MSLLTLTFDNGPHPEGTPRVLQTLDAHGVQATFFVLGHLIDTPAGAHLARTIVEAGHRLGHHSWSHRIPLGEDDRPEAISVELQATHDVLRRLYTGPRWFRPFGGGGKLGPHLLSPRAVSWLRAHDYEVVLWNSVVGDWHDATGWVERALADVEAQAHTTLVLHDIAPDAMIHLDAFLTEVKRRGHTFVVDWPRSVVPLSPTGDAPWLADCVCAGPA